MQKLFACYRDNVVIFNKEGILWIPKYLYVKYADVVYNVCLLFLSISTSVSYINI